MQKHITKLHTDENITTTTHGQNQDFTDPVGKEVKG